MPLLIIQLLVRSKEERRTYMPFFPNFETSANSSKPCASRFEAKFSHILNNHSGKTRYSLNYGPYPLFAASYSLYIAKQHRQQPAALALISSLRGLSSFCIYTRCKLRENRDLLTKEKALTAFPLCWMLTSEVR